MRGHSHGQIVIPFAMLGGVMAFSGVLALDVGVRLAERRDAQGDADSIALAGAIELPREDIPNAQAALEAVAAAKVWAAANGVDPDTELQLTVLWNSDDTSSNECFAGQGGSQERYVGLRVTVTRTVPSFFLRLFKSIGDVNDLTRVSMSATACTGRPTELAGFMPMAVSESGACFRDDGTGGREPILFERCDLVIDNLATGLLGQLGLPQGGDCSDGNPNANQFEENLLNGAGVTCSILGGEVQGNPGFNVGKTKTGIEGRLATEGSCETRYPATAQAEQLFLEGNAYIANPFFSFEPLASPSRTDDMDDFWEVFLYDPTRLDNLQTLDCGDAEGIQTSPRNVVVIVVADYAAPDGSCGPQCYIIQDFARMYIEGCTYNGTFYKDCDWNGGGSFTIHARFVNADANSAFTLGYTDVGTLQTFLKE